MQEVDLVTRYTKASHRTSSSKSTVANTAADAEAEDKPATAHELAAAREERDRQRAEKRARLKAMMEEELKGMLGRITFWRLLRRHELLLVRLC